ncbi:MAG TPA: hypothetical protein VFO54_10400, partial [Chryseosolibacter sp.]|nr:hypothetical protein [Chryseosolibacter sp.]
SLAESGAHIIFIDKGPRAASGYSDFENQSRRFAEVLDGMRERIHSGADLGALIGDAGIKREQMVDADIQGIRKRNPAGGWIYFINNPTRKVFEGWLPLSVAVDGIMLFDPMTGNSGKGRIRKSSSGTEVYARLDPAQSLIVESYSSSIGIPEFPYIEMAGAPIALTGQWKMTFDSGGPQLPPPNSTNLLVYWTDLKLQAYKDFSGTATYELSFDKPAGDPKRWLLKLDSVKESAEVILNGQSIGTLIGPVYQLELASELFKDSNVLQIKVSNLMANRIAYMDRNKIFWKKFYNVNFPSRLRENSRDNLFTAEHWRPRPSGLMGNVQLYPLR